MIMKLNSLVKSGKMSELQARNYMSRIRDNAYRDGAKITRIIRQGIVVEQRIIGWVKP